MFPLSLALQTGREFTSSSPTVCNCSLDRKETMPSGPSARWEAPEHLVSFISTSLLMKVCLSQKCVDSVDERKTWTAATDHVLLVNTQLVQDKRSWVLLHRRSPSPPCLRNMAIPLCESLSWVKVLTTTQRKNSSDEIKLHTTDPICVDRLQDGSSDARPPSLEVTPTPSTYLECGWNQCRHMAAVISLLWIDYTGF